MTPGSVLLVIQHAGGLPDNGRSPDSEILDFANDILTNRPRGAPYKGVEVIRYNPKGVNWNVLLRRGMKAIFDAAAAHGKEPPKTIAVLTDTGPNALSASKALSALGDANKGKAIAHKLHFDEAEALLTARLVAFLLEPKPEAGRDSDVAMCMTLLADARKSTGTGKLEVATMIKQSLEVRAGKSSKAAIVGAFRAVLTSLYQQGFSGNPATDWMSVKQALRETSNKDLLRAAQQLDYLFAFQRGDRISAGLADEWLRDGTYTHAREALDLALAQEQLLDGTQALAGVHIMNVHKAKGKQYDGVILVRQPKFVGPKPNSSFVWRGDAEPFPKSRKIIRVAASRARDHLVVLDPIWPACPILKGHKLV